MPTLWPEAWAGGHETRRPRSLSWPQGWLCSWRAENKQREGELETPQTARAAFEPGATLGPGKERLPGDCHSALQALLCLPVQAAEQLPPSSPSPWPPPLHPVHRVSQLAALCPLSHCRWTDSSQASFRCQVRWRRGRRAQTHPSRDLVKNSDTESFSGSLLQHPGKSFLGGCLACCGSSWM